MTVGILQFLYHVAKVTNSDHLSLWNQDDSDTIKYRRVLVSTLLHAFVHDFTTFAECIANKVWN
jgi:hypothetical protein